MELFIATRSIFSYHLLILPPINRQTLRKKSEYLHDNLNSQPQIQTSQPLFFFLPFSKHTRKNNPALLSTRKKKKTNMCSKMAFTLTIPRFHSPISREPTTTCSSPPSKTQSAHFSHGRSISLRRRLFLLPVKATTDQSGLWLVCPLDKVSIFLDI